MTQNELNRAVARATGETVAEISRRGFTLDAPPAAITEFDQDDLPRIDWDLYDLERNVALVEQRQPLAVA